MSKDNGSAGKATWNGYVNFAPNSSEREAIKASLFSPDKLERWIADKVADGYKVEFYYDDYRESMVCALYGLFADNPNAGRKLVVPHADPLVAVSAVAFFVEVIAEGGEWPKQQALNNPYDW